MAAPLPQGHAHLSNLRQACDDFGTGISTSQAWGATLAARLVAGARLLAAGNGGSAAQAQHLTAELVGRYRDDRMPFSAICLSAETSSLTAIINDYHPDELFARQVTAHGRHDDVLLLLSTSGRSPNVVTAAHEGRSLGLRVWAMTGPGPNPLSQVAHQSICVPASHTATVQELHLVALHVMCAAVDHWLTTVSSTSRRGEPASRRHLVSGWPVSSRASIIANHLGDGH